MPRRERNCPRSKGWPGSRIGAAASRLANRGTLQIAGNPPKVWDLATGKLARTLATPSTVCSQAFSPDQQRLVTSFLDQNMSISRPDTGEAVLNLYNQGCTQLQFSPAGSRLYAFGGTGLGILDFLIEQFVQRGPQPVPPFLENFDARGFHFRGMGCWYILSPMGDPNGG
jgi:hypothetical protein